MSTKEKTPAKQTDNPVSKYRYVTIEPYADPSIPNAGFEKIGSSGVPEAEIDLGIASTNLSGMNKIMTGLDQNSYDILRIKDDEERTAKQSEIAKITAYLKKKYGVTEQQLDSQNFNFWHHPDFRIKVPRGKGLSFDVENNYRDLLKVLAIKAGGYPEIAPNFQEAVRQGKSNQKVTHYLHDQQEVDDVKSAPTIEKAMLIKQLADKYADDPLDFLYIATVLLPANKQYTRRSGAKGFFMDVLSYMESGDGVSQKVNMKQRLGEVKQVLAMDNEELQTRAIMKAAEYLRYIRKEKDGDYIEVQSTAVMGRTNSQIFEFLKNPLNGRIFEELRDKVEVYWNK